MLPCDLRHYERMKRPARWQIFTLAAGIVTIVLVSLYLIGCVRTASAEKSIEARLAALTEGIDQAEYLREAAALRINEYLKLGDIAAETNPALTLRERYEIGKAVATYSAIHGIEPQLVLAVIEVESSARPGAVSHKGARGLMQVMPWWPKRLGLEGMDLMDIEANVHLGTFILADNIQRWGYREGIERYCYGTGKTGRGYYSGVLKAIGRIDGRV